MLVSGRKAVVQSSRIISVSSRCFLDTYVLSKTDQEHNMKLPSEGLVKQFIDQTTNNLIVTDEFPESGFGERAQS